jgi:hypothetical protein
LRKRSTFDAPKELKTSQNGFVFESASSGLEIVVRPLFDRLSISQVAKVSLADIEKELEDFTHQRRAALESEGAVDCEPTAGAPNEEQKLEDPLPNDRASTNDESAEKDEEAAQNESMNEAFERAYGVRIF